jgi:starch phosphorylase
MLVAEQLVQGADLWVNTPRRPWEASGTSGMKVLVNGGVNLSELDGWWAEAWQPELGWAIGDGREHGLDPAWDATEGRQLYELLEKEIVPEFYRHDARGIPAGWVARMRRSMAQLAPRFSTNRMLREYLDHYYLRLAEAYRRRRVDAGCIGRDIEAWRKRLFRHWPALHWDEVEVRREGDGHRVRLQVYLDGLEAEDLAVECYGDAVDDWPMHCQRLRRGDALPGAVNGFAYEGVLNGDRPLSHYTLRLVPDHSEAEVPLELPLITWLDKTLERFTDE